MTRRQIIAAMLAAGSQPFAKAAPAKEKIKSRQSGPWSAATTWEGGSVPGAGAVVEIAAGHKITYDTKSDQAIRFVHILGHLAFATDRDTQLDVGLLKIGGDDTEDGAANQMVHHHSGTRARLEVGTPDKPVPAGHTARIRLAYFPGTDKDTLPSLICCGGQMDFHGAPLSRTWVKLGAPVRKGDTAITLAEPVQGWRVGDRILLTATRRQKFDDDTLADSVRDDTQTEEHIVKAIAPDRITIEKAAAFAHTCEGKYRGEVANLSRNVIVESANPEIQRGHTMYHHGSAGSISYAEFRRLGKEGVLGRYTIHFHQVRDSMRGSSVIGASIWDSGNRWITIHGTDYLVVRDCVGYNSIGHGFFLEDGTEVYNVFDRNLAVQARTGKILKGQVLPFDHNSGSGFWWANNLNTFTRNVSCESDVYGYRFDMQKTASFNPVLGVPKPDGSLQTVDVRTLPFIRFEDNESHCQRNHALNIGGLDINLTGGCGRVGPDVHHPIVVRNMTVWDSHWSFHTMAPCVILDNYDIHDCAYGMWKPNIVNHEYHAVHMEKIGNHVVLDGEGQLPESFGKGTLGPAKLFDLSKYNSGALLRPVDDLPPLLVVTYVGGTAKGKTIVRGTASDSGAIKRLRVNGHDVRAIQPNFAQWEVALDGLRQPLVCSATDASGNTVTVKLS